MTHSTTAIMDAQVVLFATQKIITLFACEHIQINSWSDTKEYVTIGTGGVPLFPQRCWIEHQDQLVQQYG